MGESNFISKYSSLLLPFFANGSEVQPEKIKPKLIPVEKPDSFEGRLFRFATSLWSVPVSRGYGRRMRYLVMDAHNNKLMGLFALGDPVLNMKARDTTIGWTVKDRMERLYHVMDAYVLGAVPPYNDLLIGKLIALTTTTDEVRRRFRKRYSDNVTVIAQEKKRADLVVVTTTSALGRSSIYNRLSVKKGASFTSIGYTSGYGHFHISDELFERLRNWMRGSEGSYADNHRFGQGPNWRMRLLRQAFQKLDVQPEAINHGIQREVFMAPLAHNYKDILTGASVRPAYQTVPLREVMHQFRERWLLPRAERIQRWRTWDRSMLLADFEIANVGSFEGQP